MWMRSPHRPADRVPVIGLLQFSEFSVVSTAVLFRNRGVVAITADESVSFILVSTGFVVRGFLE